MAAEGRGVQEKERLRESHRRLVSKHDEAVRRGMSPGFRLRGGSILRPAIYPSGCWKWIARARTSFAATSICWSRSNCGIARSCGIERLSILPTPWICPSSSSTGTPGSISGSASPRSWPRRTASSSRSWSSTMHRSTGPVKCSGNAIPRFDSSRARRTSDLRRRTMRHFSGRVAGHVLFLNPDTEIVGPAVTTPVGLSAETAERRRGRLQAAQCGRDRPDQLHSAVPDDPEPDPGLGGIAGFMAEIVSLGECASFRCPGMVRRKWRRSRGPA